MLPAQVNLEATPMHDQLIPATPALHSIVFEPSTCSRKPSYRNLAQSFQTYALASHPIPSPRLAHRSKQLSLVFPLNLPCTFRRRPLCIFVARRNLGQWTDRASPLANTIPTPRFVDYQRFTSRLIHSSCPVSLHCPATVQDTRVRVSLSSLNLSQNFIIFSIIV
jgi:hypothetical protein